MSDSSENIYRGGQSKAQAEHLVAHFQSRGISVEHLENMHPAIREHYTRSVGLNAPSEEIWGHVVSRMKRLKSHAWSGGNDPLSGVS